MKYTRLIARTAALLHFVTLSILASCVSSSIAAYRSPDHAELGYSKVMIVPLFQDLSLVQAAERHGEEVISKGGGTAVLGSGLVLPGTSLDDLRVAVRMRTLGIDSILLIAFADQGVPTSIAPITSSTTAMAFQSPGSPGMQSISFGQSTTTVAGGGVVDKPWARFDAALFDVRDGACAWRATITTAGGAGVTWERLVRTAIGIAASRLLSERVVVPPADSCKAVDNRSRRIESSKKE